MRRTRYLFVLVLASTLFVLGRPTCGASTFEQLPKSSRALLQSCEVNAKILDTYLAMDYTAFDQDFNAGWRPLGQRVGCELAAAELIKLYILYSTPTPPTELTILRWHAGQLHANAGQHDAALAYFRGAYQASAEESDPTWELYVDGTIAFLQGDRPELQRVRDVLAKVEVSEEEKESRRQMEKEHPNINFPEGWIDQPQNLSVLDRFLRCFGRPYADAYSGDCKEPG